MPSQGILHVPSLNVSPANTQRLGVVAALCELGVVALHGTEEPRAWGGRMQEATGPVALSKGRQGQGGCSESPWFQTGRPHSCISKWQVVAPVVLPEYPAYVLDTYLRMTVRSLAFVTSDSQLAFGSLLCNFLRDLCSIGKQAPQSTNIKIQIATNTPLVVPGF